MSAEVIVISIKLYFYKAIFYKAIFEVSNSKKPYSLFEKYSMLDNFTMQMPSEFM